jgi:hypothetical protein
LPTVIAYRRLLKNPALDTTTAACESVFKTAPQTTTAKDGRWRTFPKNDGLMQFIPSAVYFARAKVNGKAIRASLTRFKFYLAH